MNKLDPRTKMVIVISISTAVMLITDIKWLCILLMVVAAGMLAGGIRFSQMKKQIQGALKMILFLFLLQLLFRQVDLGILLCLRLLILILSAIILLTGETRDYLLGLIQWKMPHEIAYMIILALHFFPVLREEALDVYYSMQLRGTEMQKIPIRKKLYLYKRMCIPILSGAMERVQDTSISMEARGFCAYRKRTYMRKLILKKRDWFWMFLVPVFMIGLVGCSYYTGN